MSPPASSGLHTFRWFNEQDRELASQASAAANLAGETARAAAGVLLDAAYRDRRTFARAHVVRRVKAHKAALAHVLQASLVGTCFHSGIVKAEQKSLADLDTIRKLCPNAPGSFHDIHSMFLGTQVPKGVRSPNAIGVDLVPWSVGMDRRSTRKL